MMRVQKMSGDTEASTRLSLGLFRNPSTVRCTQKEIHTFFQICFCKGGRAVKGLERQRGVSILKRIPLLSMGIVEQKTT